MFLNKSIIIEGAKKLKALFLDLIFPIQCLGCGQEGIWLCRECFRRIKFKEIQYCLHCKKENKFGQFCSDCSKFYFLNGVWIAGDYEDELVTNLVKSLKYHFIEDLSGTLGRFLALFLRDLINKNRFIGQDLYHGEIWRKLDKIKRSPQIFLNFNESLIIPVPLHTRRERWRGFNQVEIIAFKLANYFNIEISVGRLVRVKYAKAQAKLGEEERRNNIKNCFTWQADNLAGRNVVLVDDVVTTGATLNECARVLKGNGAGEVWGLVVAKG
jgi:ComF family protein